MADDPESAATTNSKAKNMNVNNPLPSILPMECQLKNYLLLMATLVATVTYTAGLDPPGGSWLEDDSSVAASPSGSVLAVDSILRDTNYTRYIVFYCFNAVSFAASLMVSLLLHKDDKGRLLQLTRAVMVLDLLGLMGAYAAGTSHDRFTTVCASVLVVATAAYVIFAVPTFGGAAGATTTGATTTPSSSPPPAEGVDDDREKHEILMVLAIFVATVAYVAGLNPPGGFWRSTLLVGHQRRHTAGDPVLQALHPIRYKFFFFSNTSAFIASLLGITFTVHYEKLGLKSIKVPLYGLVIIAILGLGGAYAAGSCRDSKHTTYVLALIVPAVLCIFLQRLLVGSVLKLPCYGTGTTTTGTGEATKESDLDKIREFIQFLAILAATVAYQAGVDPPGGVWADSGEGQIVGYPILLTTHPVRFKFFFYFNSAAFVASLVIMAMLQNEFLVRRHALEAVMILDLFGLIGAYAAGSCRDTSTSIYTLALAGGVLVYVVIHIVFFTLDPRKHDDANKNNPDEEKRRKKEENVLEKKREVLLLLAILAATLTYQAGLTPPGGMWENDGSGHRAGFPVLQDKYPRRYMAFFYCNAASFMASVALIVLLLNPNLYGPGIKCYALFVCMVTGMFSLIGAYAAGSSLHLRTSIVVLVLVVAVFAAVVYGAIIRHRQDAKTNNPAGNPDPRNHAQGQNSNNIPVQGPNSNVPEGQNSYNPPGDPSTNNLVQGQNSNTPAQRPIPNNNPAGDPNSNNPPPQGSNSSNNLISVGANNSNNAAHQGPESSNPREASMYLMLVGILAASVTYLTGLKPPGGLWREDVDGHTAGNPVLYDIDKHRYNAFFYSNSTSFMASITVIVLLLRRMLRDRENDKNKLPLWPMHTVMFLDMLALLGAYAAGSARSWCTSKDVILLLLPVLGFIALLFFWKKGKSDGTQPS